MHQRLTFGHLIDRLFWFLLTMSVVYAASQLKTMSTSVEDLNNKVSVILEKLSNAEKRADNFDHRLEILENLRFSR